MPSKSLGLFNRCNISEDLIKRFTSLRAAREGTSPTKENKAELEKFLLSVPLDDDVAHFSDSAAVNKTKRSSLPLYDNYESDICLPSTGYKSDSERRYPIRTCNSTNQSPNRSPESSRRANVRRTQSLNANTVTDRIWEIREKLAQSRKDKKKQTEKTPDKVFEFRNSNTSLDTLSTTNQVTASIKRSRSFNINSASENNQDKLNNKVDLKLLRERLKSTSVSHIRPSDIDKIRHCLRGNTWKQTDKTSSSNLRRIRTVSETNRDPQGNGVFKSNSFSTLQDAWERSILQRDSIKNTPGPPIPQVEISLSDVDNDDTIYRRRERRRAKREGLLTTNDRSDSETEGEDGQLTQAALERLDRRQRVASRRNGPLARRRARIDSDSADENNNETSSDKTLDSGVYELTLSNLSENISQLSKRYDSDEFILDDHCLSPKSDYSSAAESVCESTTTFYDSTEEDMDKKNKAKSTRLKTKTGNTNMKTAVLNASRLKSSGASNTATSVNRTNSLNNIPSASKQIENSSGKSSVTKDKKLTNKKLESPTKTSAKQISSMKGSKSSESVIADDRGAKLSLSKQNKGQTSSSPTKSTDSGFTVDKNSSKKEDGKTLQENQKILSKQTEVTKTKRDKFSSARTTPVGTPTVSRPTTPTISQPNTPSSISPDTSERLQTPHHSSLTKLDRKSSNSLNKESSSPIKGVNSKQSKEQQERIDSLSQPQRKESVHHKCCITADNNTHCNSGSQNNNKASMSSARRKSSSISPVKRKESLQQKNAQVSTLISLSDTIDEKESLTHQEKNKQGELLDEKITNANDDLTADNNGIKTDEENVSNKDTGSTINLSHKHERSDGEGAQGMENLQSKFIVNRVRSSIDETNSKHRLLNHGETIELHLSFDNNASPSRRASPPLVKPKPNKEETSNAETPATIPTTTPTTTTTTKTETLPTTTPKSDKKAVPPPLPKPKVEKKIKKSLNKGVQCLILTGETILSGEVINVSDTSKQVTINETVLKELGDDILQDIQFTYPEYLIDPSESETEPEEISEEVLNAVKLKLENRRLQKLLFDVEKARAGSVKALLHVNTLLNKVQGDNTRLEGEIKVCTHEKDKLLETLKPIQEDEISLDFTDGVVLPGDTTIHKSRRDTVNNSLSIIVDNWKKEKKELLAQLNTSKKKEEEADNAACRLRAQYKKVKEQLDHSNNAFSMTLKNNLDASKQMEEELRSSINDKQDLINRCEESSKYKQEVERLQQELDELKQVHEELEDEKDQMEDKVRHLEKQNRHLQFEEEELHEQVAQAHEIIEKLTDAEEELKNKLQKEIKDKIYLQECLDETGQILYQLKHNEQVLHQEKDLLLDDLEAELEEKETLQSTLSSTMTEHKEIMDRLQNMTNIHITVKESLQQANKKEKNYQEQIDSLTKTNHILHYTLEKEKEERLDLQEMFDIIESDHRKSKSEFSMKVRDYVEKNNELMFSNHQLIEAKDSLEKKVEEQKASLEQEEEANAALRVKLARFEQTNETLQSELDVLKDSGEEIEKNITGMSSQQHDLEVELNTEKERNEKLVAIIEETETSLERVKKQLNDAKVKIEEYRCDHDDMHSKLKERHKKIRDLESRLEEATEFRNKYQNRMNYYETETKQLRKKVNEQTEEIGTLQIENQRFARERDTNKRNCDMAVRDYEDHKIKCTDALKRMKDEIIELGHKIVEKDRLALKYKDSQNDIVDNSKTDLQFLRNMVDSNIQKRDLNRLSSNASDISDNEKLDLNFLRKSHDKFRDEFQSHVNKLEDMLKNSTESNDIVTVVQSPMSKIKLEELKHFRNEVYELHAELGKMKAKLSNLAAEITSLKFEQSSTITTDTECSKSLSHVEAELSRLNELITKIECRHKAVMSRNAVLLQKTLADDELTSRDLVKKFQVISLEGENKQLRTLLGILKKKYDFNETELANELQMATENGASGNQYSGLTNGENHHPNELEINGLHQTRPRMNMSPRTDHRYNGNSSRSSGKKSKTHSFTNDIISAESSPQLLRKYSRDIHLRSSGVSSYSSDEGGDDDDDDDYSPPRGLPKRYNTTTSRSRRPRT